MSDQFPGVSRILVIKFRHIGDVLLTSPVFAALRARFPGASIAAAVLAGTEDVLTGNPDVDEVYVLDRSAPLGRRPIERIRSELSFLFRIMRKGFDMSVDLTSGDRAALLSVLCGARYRLAYDPGKGGFKGKRRLYTHRGVRDGSTHMVLQNLDLLAQFGIRAERRDVEMHVPEEAREFAASVIDRARMRGPVVHVHPTAKWLFKCWGDAEMAEVITRLLAGGATVVFTSSPVPYEMQRAVAILQRIPDKRGLIDLSGKIGLKQLAAVAEASDVFFGMDSAPMHIAAAVGTPVVALFGPSGAFNWGPWQNEGTGPHIVIQRSWPCVPCGKDGCRGTKISDCLMDIRPDEVIEAIAGRLAETGAGDDKTAGGR